MKKLVIKHNQTPQKTTSKKKSKSPVVYSTTKGELIKHLLNNPEGIDIPELIKATGWQTHSIRGFISGTLRKKLNLNVISEISSNGSRKYRITATEA